MPSQSPDAQARAEFHIQQELARVVEHEDTVLRDGVPMRIVRYRAVRRLTVLDNQQHVRAEWLVPREEVVVTPAVIN
jgi:hypothetical protein